MLDEGRYASISDISAVEKIDRGYVGSVLRLTLLAPDIIEAVLDGLQLAELARISHGVPDADDEARGSVTRPI